MTNSTAITITQPTTLTVTGQADTTLVAVVEMVTNAVSSKHTKRAYSRALMEFIHWHSEAGQSRKAAGCSLAP